MRFSARIVYQVRRRVCAQQIAAVLAAAVLTGGSTIAVAAVTKPTAAAAPRSTAAIGNRSATSQRPSATLYDWQSKGRDNSQDSYQNDTKMSAAIAPTLGVNWMTNLLAADVGGPTVAFNPTYGKTVVYSGNERGDLSAVDESNGQALWSATLGVGDSIYSTPMISSDESSVWVGTAFRPNTYKLNTATGAIQCAMPQLLPIQGSVTEGKSSTGVQQAYISSIDGPGHTGPELAYRESDCKQIFSSNPYKTPNSGSWASVSYGTDANGRKLIFQGTSDPDSTEYAIDATTGALDWSFVTDQQGDADIGAASTVSAPKNNGFADGVLYVINKGQFCYAVDLTTGAPIWQYNFGQDAGTPGGNARSSAALAGNTLVFGMANGVYALNATTGAKLWHYVDPAKLEVISSPAVVGPPGQEVVAFADVAGAFHVLRLSDGSELYHYQTGNYITASPAYYNGHFLITSADGFLYDFAAGGGNGSAPKTTITSPSQGSTVPYAKTVTITGTASDTTGVNAVEVGIQSGGSSGSWYNAASGAWSPGALTNTVAVAQPGATSSSWTIAVPIPASGTTLEVYANAVNAAHLADLTGAQVGFAVSASSSQPQLRTSSVFIAPAATFVATGVGFSAGESVVFSVAGAGIGSAKADSSGTVTTSLTLPATSQFGVTPLTAKGATSKKSAFTPIDIANAWLQAGYSPEHAAFEPNDPTLQHIISVGGNNFLARSWYYAAGAPVESSPAVYNGSVFFGNDAGTLTAIGTDTAAPIWTVNLPSGAAIRSTPAIDPSTGNLTFSADDGNVYIVSAANGSGAGSVSIGGLLTSPTVQTGTIYVGSDNATVTALNEQTGAKIWADTLGAAVHATPTLDTTTRILVIGDDSGTISALNATSGSVLWQMKTGGPVTAAPSIAKGIVYAGSSDGNLYAIDEASGKSVWTYRTMTPLTTGSPYDPILNLVYAGGANGTVYALNAANGTLAWTTSAPGAKSGYVGLSALDAFVLANNSAGSLIAYHASQFGRFNSNHKTGAALTTAPTINDGTVYVGASDGGVYAYTPYGALPQAVPAAIRRADATLSATHRRNAWPAAQAVHPRFAWAGQRDYAIHVDAISRTRLATAAPLRYHGGPVQNAPHSYVVFWKPATATIEGRYIPAVTALLKTGAVASAAPLAGAFIDTTPYPALLSDGAIQTEIAKAIAVNRWPTGINSQFLILTANGATGPAAGFCSYHSAFSVAHDRTKLVAYAVVPYSGALSACGAPAGQLHTGDPAIDAVSANLMRVGREMRNDPLMTGWYGADGNEVGPAF